MKSKTSELIAAARGEMPADVILKNAKIVNVFTGEVEEGDAALYGGRIAGIGKYDNAKKVIDLENKYLAPGLINGHTHLESSMLDVPEYVRAVVAHGTTTIVTDLHEIANVCGMNGINYVLKNARRLPIDLFLMAPSCVPSTHLETAGASIGVDDIRKLLKLKNCIGLGEMMNSPGVIFQDTQVLGKIEAAAGKIIDGHAPSVTGKDLNSYISAGIMSDHECVRLEEAEEKLRLGMHIFIREGSSEKNLEALLPIVNDRTWPMCCFVVDDRSCSDLLRDGDIDAVVRKAIRLGLEPVRAIQMATINAARYFRLENMGAVAPGYYANLLIIDNLKDLSIRSVMYRGKFAAENGKSLFTAAGITDESLTHSVNIKRVTADSIKLKRESGDFPVIEVVPGQIITRMKKMRLKEVKGFIEPDLNRDILKLVVIERHLSSGRVGIGMVKGLGLKRGAIASTVGHDSHNLIIAGTNDKEILTAVKEIEKIQGGLVVVKDGKVTASLPLPVAGLMAQRPLEEVVDEFEKVEKAVKETGSNLAAPFALLSFLALPVIPEIRLTDLGIVDVNAFKLIS
jgi:adenine deaminase